MVAFDAVGPSASGTHSATTPLTWTHTPVGTPTAILIGVTTFTGTTNKVTAVTYGGTSCSLLGFSESGGTAAAGGIACYGLLSPPSGAQTVSVTFTGAASTIAGSTSYTGPVSGFGTVFTANSVTSTSVSVSVTGTTSGGMIGCVACQGSGTAGFAGTNSVTVRYATNVSASSAADNSVGGTVPSAGGSQTVGFTNPSADDWGLVAVELIPGGIPYTGTNGTLGTPAIPGQAQPGNFIPGQIEVTVSALNVNAGLATGAGAALAPSVPRSAGLATGTGTASAPGIGITAGLATATGAAFGLSIVVNAGLATGTGTAGGISIQVIAGLASGVGAANAPNFAITSGLATGTGAALAPSVPRTTGLASGTGAAFGLSIVVNAGLASGVGAAGNITVQSPGVSAGLATAAGTAGGISIAVNAGLATGTGTALAPAVALTPGLATGTGTAFAPTTPFTIGLAAGAATSFALTAPRSISLATGTGTAFAPSVPLTIGLATGAGTAFAPSVPRTPGLATGTGAAFVPSVPRSAGLATGTGTALPPALNTGTRTNVDYTGSTLANTNTLGGTVSVFTLGGTLSVNANTLGGTLTVVNTLGGTLTVFVLGGTLAVTSDTLTGTLSVVVTTLSGTAVEDKMQEVDIILNEFNDATVTFQILNNASPMNITGMTVNALFKKTRGDLDSAGTTKTYSSAGGSPAITIVTPTTGSCTLAVPDADVIFPNFTFYRIDVVNGSVQTTAIFGTVTITQL